MQTYLALALFVLAFAMIANRLSKTIITAPQVFIFLGFVFAEVGMVPEGGSEDMLHLVAEITLIVLLFLDAAQIDVRQLRSHFVWPARMLLVGLPLVIALGTVALWPFLPSWPLVGVALLAAILAPTDAALGQAVVSNKAVPERPRRALIVESGLNDGLALPIILFLAVLAAPMAMAPAEGWTAFAAKQLVFGPLVGLAFGYTAGRVLLWAKRTEYTSEAYEGVGAIALAASSFLAAVCIGGNGLIAAFCAGLAFGAVVQGRCPFIYEFTENEGQFLSWASFFLLGLVLVPEALEHLTWQVAGLILVSLFVVRPLAIWLSLAGTDAQPVTKLFFGWFGPRGLATALFALVVVEDLGHDLGHDVLMIAVNTVWISALLHGLTAVPGANWYARRVEEDKMDAEMEPLPDGAITGPMKT